MKTRYFLTLLSFFAINVFFAQGESQDDCHAQYLRVFENRGAFELKDGEFDNCIMVIKKDGVTECVLVTVLVKNMEIVEVAAYYEDNTKEAIDFVFVDKGSWTVINGMSKPRVTMEGQKIILMFTDLIKPKKKKYKKAPLPKFDLND